MVDKRRIVISAGSSVAQVIISGFTVFLLYRYLLEIIGPEKLGIWALVLSVSSMVQAANLGMTGSIVKHIADYDALGDKKKITLATQTAAISIALFSLVFVGGVFPAAKYYFQFALEPRFYRDALEILPLALVSFWIYMMIGIYMGALYGCHRIVQRNAVLVADSLSHFGLCVILAPGYGLIGLAYARLIQNCLTLVVVVVLLKKYVPGMPVLPYRWNKDLFKEMFGYAASFQIIAILGMLTDPLTKGFLSKYGNVSMVAYYEMAQKFVQLFRALLANANQVLVPTFARINQLDPKNILNIYLASYRLIFYLAVPGFSLLAISAPLVSELWVGYYEPVFVSAVIMLCIGWLVNILSVPAYHSGMGTGHMKENVIAHVTVAVTNVIAILVVGRLLGGMGVVVARVFAMMFGAMLLMYLYHKRSSLRLNEAIPESSRLLALLSMIGVTMSYLLWQWLPGVQAHLVLLGPVSDSLVHGIVSAIMILFFVLLVAIPMWNHPVRRQLSSLGASSK